MTCAVAHYDEAELETQLQARGLMYRFFGRFMRSIKHTWQLYFVGLIFGMGFDTTTEVVLLAATAYAAIQGLPYYAVLALPFLFGGGLMLFDTLDGLFMNFAYGWAFAKPVRKVYYNLVITGLSIGAAFIIGTIEIIGVLTDELHLNGGFWSVAANFDINTAGFCIAAPVRRRLGGRAGLLAVRPRRGPVDGRRGEVRRLAGEGAGTGSVRDYSDDPNGPGCYGLGQPGRPAGRKG